MRNRIGTFLATALAATAISLPALPGERQSRPNLDCQKMALDYAQAFENLDLRTLFLLQGQPYSKEAESAAKKRLGSPEAKKLLAPLIKMIRSFPKIGEIPGWVTEVNIEYQYVEGSDLIEMQGNFVFKEGIWIIQDLEPRGGETLDEEKKAQYAGELSPAPPEGRKTLDAGFNEPIAKLIAAVQQKSRDGVKEAGVHFGDVGLHPEDPPEEREKVLKLLSQFPSVGPITAPAKYFRLGLKGTLDGKDSAADIGFHWPGNQLKIEFVRFE